MIVIMYYNYPLFYWSRMNFFVAHSGNNSDHNTMVPRHCETTTRYDCRATFTIYRITHYGATCVIAVDRHTKSETTNCYLLHTISPSLSSQVHYVLHRHSAKELGVCRHIVHETISYRTKWTAERYILSNIERCRVAYSLQRVRDSAMVTTNNSHSHKAMGECV